jgi:hypothetical protein
MFITPELHVSVPHVEMLADVLMLLLPIFPLTSPGPIQSGLATTAVLELNGSKTKGNNKAGASWPPLSPILYSISFVAATSVELLSC